MKEIGRRGVVAVLEPCSAGYKRKVLHVIDEFVPSYELASGAFDEDDLKVELVANEGEEYFDPDDTDHPDNIKVPEGLTCLAITFKAESFRTRFYSELEKARRNKTP